MLYTWRLRIVLLNNEVCFSLYQFQINALMFGLWISFLDYLVVKVTIQLIPILISSLSLCGWSPVLWVKGHSVHLSRLIFSFPTLLGCLVYQKWCYMIVIQSSHPTFGKPYESFYKLKYYLQVPIIHRQKDRLKGTLYNWTNFEMLVNWIGPRIE